MIITNDYRLFPEPKSKNFWNVLFGYCGIGNYRMLLEEDQCSHYTMPSLTRSKIGEYISTDYLLNTYLISTRWLCRSCDPPRLPPGWRQSAPCGLWLECAVTDYNNYLMKNRPVFWREEMTKQGNMSTARTLPGVIRSVRFRAITPDVETGHPGGEEVASLLRHPQIP